MEHMQRNNAKDDAVEGGENGERPPSSQPIAPAVAGQAPPRPAGRIIPQFDPSWRRTIPETYAAFAKSTAVLKATPMTKAKMMPRLLREIVETILDIHLDLGNWLQGFLPWEVPDGLYTTIAPNCFASIRDLANRYPKAEDIALVGKLTSAFKEFARTKRPCPALTPDEEANLRFCCRTIVEGYAAKLYPAYWNLVRWVCRNPFRFLTALRIVRRHRHLRLTPPPHPSAEDWKRTNEILNEKLESLNQTIRHEHERTRRQIIKSINTRNIDGLDISGPRTQECRNQVLAVVVWLANPKHLQNVHHACEQTFRTTKVGYESAERLYIWCYRNESRIWAWVETYRLSHGID